MNQHQDLQEAERNIAKKEASDNTPLNSAYNNILSPLYSYDAFAPGSLTNNSQRQTGDLFHKDSVSDLSSVCKNSQNPLSTETQEGYSIIRASKLFSLFSSLDLNLSSLVFSIETPRRIFTYFSSFLGYNDQNSTDMESDTESIFEEENEPLPTPSTPEIIEVNSSFAMSSPSFFSSILTHHSLADRLPAYLNLIVTNGKLSVVGLLAVYFVLLGFWFPLWLLSYALSELGVYITLVLSGFKIGRSVLRLIAFPGASKRVSNEIEKEFSKMSVKVLESGANTCSHVANLILACEKKSVIESNGDVSIVLSKDSFKHWSRLCFLRDRLFGVLVDVLNCLLYEHGIRHRELDEPGSIRTNITSYGSNCFVGSIGNLSDITSQARENGETLHKLLIRILDDIQLMENHFGSINQGKVKLTGTKEIFVIARKMRTTSNELRDFLCLLKRPNSSNPLADSHGNDNNENENGKSFWENVKETVSSVLPMIDPPLHTTIFGLDVLRGCVLSRYHGAKQIWISKPNGKGMIDAIHIPSPTNGTCKKAVLYCNPNAGFYESSTGLNYFSGNLGNNNESQKYGQITSKDEACWADFYIENGFDVYLFNYTGYGRSFSSGLCGVNTSKWTRRNGFCGALVRIISSSLLDSTPSPSTLKEDALAVGLHIKDALGVKNLVIHGESIGGMAAASTAKQLSSYLYKEAQTHKRDFNLVAESDFEVSLLVCDRTFCNLISVAQRLVGGWTAIAIKILAPFWNTDVAYDFLTSNCSKIVCTDAADAIIADASSLKSGVAEAKEMRGGSTSCVGEIRDAPLEHRMSDFENVGVLETKFGTIASRNISSPIWPADKHISTGEAFHFAACLRRIGKMATAAKKKDRTLNSAPSNDADDNPDEGVELTLKSVGKTSQHFLDYDSDDGNNRIQQRRFFNSPRRNEKNAIVEVWNILACCDGLCGAPLGFAVKNGPDCVVSWLCAAVTYGCQRVAKRTELRLAPDDELLENSVVVKPVDYDSKGEGINKDDENEFLSTPIPLPTAIEKLNKFYGEHCEGNDVILSNIANELKYCIFMMEYIVSRINSNSQVEAALDSLHFRSAGEVANGGCFLNLHCGHNNMFSIEEKYEFKSLLQEVFIDDQDLQV